MIPIKIKIHFMILLVNILFDISRNTSSTPFTNVTLLDIDKFTEEAEEIILKEER